MQNKTAQSNDIQALREQFRAKVFRMMLYIAAVFGGPAIAAYWIGKFLNQRFADHNFDYQAIALVLAFIGSWITVFRLYTKLTAEAKAIEQQAREQKNSSNPTT